MHLHESFLLGLGELQELLILVFSVYVEPYIVPFDSLSVVPVYTTYNLATFRITNGGAGLAGYGALLVGMVSQLELCMANILGCVPAPPPPYHRLLHICVFYHGLSPTCPLFAFSTLGYYPSFVSLRFIPFSFH